MKRTLKQDAYAVMLPAFDSLTLSDSVMKMLESGCVSVLLGESREEYIGRGMSDARAGSETPEDFREIIDAVKSICGSAIIAVDQEIGGIKRLHKLVSPLPDIDGAARMTDSELAAVCAETAADAHELGINLFLAPIADILTGSNPWLQGRTPGNDAAQALRIICTYIKGVQSAGVSASLKHFPGYPNITGDPAIEEAVCKASPEELEPIMNIMRAGIKAGVKTVMLGPAIVEAVDDGEPASTSVKTVNLLTHGLGFEGLIISDDLDSKSILMGRSLEQTAVDSLSAGADLLLVAAGAHLHEVADFIVESVESSMLSEERLRKAAGKVRQLAQQLTE